MKTRATIQAMVLLLTAGSLAACSSTGGPSLATASVAPQPVAKIDPACATLASQIDTLKADGVAERLEKVSTGKSASVQVKRSSLAKQAELNKAYAEFQARCSVAIPRTQSAAVTASPSTTSTASAAVAPSPASAAASGQASTKSALATKN